jgi:putative transposase
VVGGFPLLHLAGAVLVDAHDDRQVSDRRYLSEGSMAALTASNTTNTSKETKKMGRPR